MAGFPRIAVLVALAVGSILSAGCGSSPEPADLILLGGKIVTVDQERPEVRALAARGGRIVALGSDEEIRPYQGPGTHVIELDGRLAIPGFIEGHGHFEGIAASLLNVDLRDASGRAEVIGRVSEVARKTPPGQWVLGWGWHQEKWEHPPQTTVEGYPVHDALSRATPDHPVLLKHAAGAHAGIINQQAMQLAGIDDATPDPVGGTILRDARGQATGVLRETAYGLALAAYDASIARLSDAERTENARNRLSLASRECVSKGITSFQDAGASFETIDLMRSMAELHELGPRLWVMLNEDNDALSERIADYRLLDVGDGRLTVRAIKRSIDGALGSHGAWLLEPYEDLPETSGLNTLPLEVLRRTAEIADEHGFQLCVHAIGDRANRESLDLFEEQFRRNPRDDSRRWRIEHAQHLNPTEIPRFARLGVVASMQGVHCTSDGPWVPGRLGDRRSEEGAYVWRKLIEAGAVVSNGTDAPIEDVDPIANYHSTVTRLMRDGDRFYPDQVMTRMEALRSYTIDAAYAAFEEGRKGSLALGKLADITVLSRDILTIPEEQILDTEVVHTIVGGLVLYSDPLSDSEESTP